MNEGSGGGRWQRWQTQVWEGWQSDRYLISTSAHLYLLRHDNICIYMMCAQLCLEHCPLLNLHMKRLTNALILVLPHATFPTNLQLSGTIMKSKYEEWWGKKVSANLERDTMAHWKGEALCTAKQLSALGRQGCERKRSTKSWHVLYYTEKSKNAGTGVTVFKRDIIHLGLLDQILPQNSSYSLDR